MRGGAARGCDRTRKKWQACPGSWLRVQLLSALRAIQWLLSGAVAHSNVDPPMR